MPLSPLVSVIIPAYNAQTVQSVVAQTFTDWELLIVDDGSTDSTEHTVAPFLSDERIRYFKKENSGVSDTRNYGMKIAEGQFFAMLDSDDVFLPNKLERQLKAFEECPETGVCATNLSIINPEGQIIQTREPVEFYGQASVPLVAGRLTMPFSSVVFRRTVFEKTGGFDAQITSLSEDFDFLLRASAHCPFYKIKDVLLLYRTGHENATSKIGDKRRDIVMNTIIPKFRKEHPGLVRWYHAWKNRSFCYRNRAMNRESRFARTYWLLRSLACNPFYGQAIKMLIYQFLPLAVIRLLKNVLKKN